MLSVKKICRAFSTGQYENFRIKTKTYEHFTNYYFPMSEIRYEATITICLKSGEYLEVFGLKGCFKYKILHKGKWIKRFKKLMKKHLKEGRISSKYEKKFQRDRKKQEKMITKEKLKKFVDF